LPARSFEQLYQTHSQMVYWAAYGVCKNHDTAAETMQAVFVRVLENLDQFQDMSDAQCKAWLYRVAVNRSIDTLRKFRRETIADDAGMQETVDESLLPEAAALQKEQQQLVRTLVEQLPDKYREPIMLYYFANMNYTDIAQLLGMSEGTLKSRMARGRAILAKQLTERG